MAVSYIALMLFAGVALGGLALLVVLLANRQTRVLGLVLLGLLAVVPCTGLFWLYLLAPVKHQVAYDEADTAVVQHSQLHQQTIEMADGSQIETNRFLVHPVEPSSANGYAETRELSSAARMSMNPGLLELIILASVLIGVAMLIKHSNRSALLWLFGGAAVVGLLLLVSLVSYQGVEKLTSVAPINTPVPIGTDQAFDQLTEPKIALNDPEQSTEDAAEEPMESSDSTANESMASESVAGESESSASESDSASSTALQTPAASAEEAGSAAEVADSATPVTPSPPPAPAVEDAQLSHTESASENAPREPATGEPPAWVQNPPKRIGDVYRRVVQTTGATTDACYNQADDEFRKVLYSYLRDQGQPVIANNLPNYYSLTNAQLRKRFWRDEYLEKVQYPGQASPGRKLFVLVEVSPKDGNWLVDAIAKHPTAYVNGGPAQPASRARTGVRSSDMEAVTIISCLVLLSVAGVFGLLKLDEATSQRYTKRLLIGVPAAIIGFLLLLALLDDLDFI